jgi:hypothetical protein
MSIAAAGTRVGMKEQINRDNEDEIRGSVKASAASEWLLG